MQHHRPRVLVALLFPLIFSCSRARHDDPPKLVVLIAVDGLRGDLLDRYDTAFTGGFRRMRDTGHRFDNTWVDHAITVSHAGHVTLATGAHPAKHGIVDAAFYVPKGSTRVLVDAVEDTTVSIPGIPQLPGASPHLVLRDGIAEWVLGADPNARSLAVGSGNVSSLLYAFHTPADVYWYRGNGYVTSSYYRDAPAEWVREFNDSTLAPLIADSGSWECRIPEATRALARADSAVFEGDRSHTTFPHTVARELGESLKQNRPATMAGWFGWTPSLDEATLLLAERGIREMELGQRKATDCLTIVLSMVDSNSHYYGPFSLEVFDTLVRIDASLGAFFTYLDKTVGKNEYVVALSSDHGFPEAPEYRQGNGEPGRRLTAKEIEDVMSRILWESGEENAPEKSLDDHARHVAALLKNYDFIAGTYTPEELAGSGAADEFLRLYRNSYRADRVPRLPIFSLRTFESTIGAAGVMVRLNEGTMIDIDAATHGSAYDYDRRVPLLFMGAGIKRGVSNELARTIDVAPTLGALARVPVPPDVDGKALVVN
jgi:predicted AlkP superfamily pyrophosphatase or phosphodiesterase